jgi:hypothetical protein
MSEQKTTIW